MPSSVIYEWDERAMETWRAFPVLARRAFRAAARASALYLAGYTIKGYLVSAGPRYLNRRTGTLIRSVTASIATFGDNRTVFGASYGTTVSYGVKHEFGGTFTEKVRAHVRRLKRMSKKRRDVARAAVMKKWTTRGKRAAAAEAGVSYVRAHERTRTYRARRMFRDALEAREYVPKGMALRALEIVRDEHRAPNAAELLAIMGGGSSPAADFTGE